MVRNIFARLYRWLLRIGFRILPHSLPTEPTADEVTTRYLHQDGHFAASSGRVKPRAFHPPREDHKTSVFRIAGLSERNVWQLADIYVTPAVKRTILARADVMVSHVRSVGLQVEPDEPPPRHANIAGWASEKDRWMSQAQELATLAILCLPSKSTQ